MWDKITSVSDEKVNSLCEIWGCHEEKKNQRIKENFLWINFENFFLNEKSFSGLESFSFGRSDGVKPSLLDIFITVLFFGPFSQLCFFELKKFASFFSFGREVIVEKLPQNISFLFDSWDTPTSYESHEWLPESSIWIFSAYNDN